ALVTPDAELVGDRTALGGQLAADRLEARGRGRGLRRRLLLLVVELRVERLRALGAVAVDRDRLDAELPGGEGGVGDLLDGYVLGHVDGLRDRTRDERLGGRHHLHVPHVVDRARSALRLEGAVEYGQVLGPDEGRALDGPVVIDVLRDLADLRLGVAELL